MTLSRRDFLRIFGLTVAGTAISGTSLASGLPTSLTVPRTVRGRVLHPTATSTGQTVWADTLVDISGRTADHFHTSVGELPITAVQPIMPQEAVTIPVETPPFEGYVLGAVGVVRAYCDPNAPLVARVGHGGVMRVTDHLRYPQTGDWYQVSDVNENALGWTQAAHWAPVDEQPLGTAHITINRETRTLVLADGESTPINIPGRLLPGEMTAHKVAAGGTQLHGNGDTHHGVPYLLQLDDGHRLHGVYWHNDFGGTSTQIQVNTLVAGLLWQARKIHVKII